MVPLESDNAMVISVVLPIRNEARDIEDTLAALANQTLPPEQYEVVVADGGSEDETLRLVEGFAWQVQASGLHVRVLKNSQGSAAAGLNLAIAGTSTPVLVRVDGHTVVAPDYLESVLRALKGSAADCVGGCQEPQSEKPWGRAYAWATGGLGGSGGAAFRSSHQAQFVDTVYLGAWPRKTFTTYGVFDESLVRNQDDEHNMRILSGGGAVYLDPTIRSHYRPRESPRGLWRQYFAYGLWKPAVLRKHPAAMKVRHFLPSAIVLWLLVTGVGAAVGGGWIGVLHGVSQGVYLIFLLFSALTSVIRRGSFHLLFLVFLTQLILHMSYGCGFLLGLCSRRGARSHSPGEARRIEAIFARRDSESQESSLVQGFLDRGRDQVRRHLLQGHVRLGQKVIDLGCGRGDWMMALEGLGVAEDDLIGVDLSATRIAAAQARLPQATFHHGCGSSLPLKDSTIDGIVISLVFSSIQNGEMRRQILAESWRVLKPGGWLLVHDMKWRRPLGETGKFPPTALKNLLGSRRYAITTNSLTLIPPLIRWTIHWAPWLTSGLEKIACLRSHWMARIDKEPS